MVATVETWDLSPEFPVEQTVRKLDYSTGYDRGIVQRANIQTSVSVNTDEPETLVWSLRWALASLDDWDRYVDIWRTSQRGALPISFTPPGGSATPVYIIGEPQALYSGPNGFQMTVQLEEAINT